MLKIISNYLRIFNISYILIRNRHNMALALEKLGPSFIKLGQFLSTRPDLIGIELADSFGYLRDKLPHFSFDIVKQIIKNELGLEIDKIYSEFNPIPVAAASVAQVHQAISIDGKKVAVKIRRPNIEKQLAKDIQVFLLCC